MNEAASDIGPVAVAPSAMPVLGIVKGFLFLMLGRR
jgi:hypothetical protein